MIRHQVSVISVIQTVSKTVIHLVLCQAPKHKARTETSLQLIVLPLLLFDVNSLHTSVTSFFLFALRTSYRVFGGSSQIKFTFK